MTISMYQASVAQLVRVLTNLDHLLDRAQAHVAAGEADEGQLMRYQLIADMYPFAKQVQIACDKARSVVARLAGLEVPYYVDDEQTLAALRLRISKSIEFLRSVRPQQVDGTEDDELVLPVTGQQTRYHGMQLLFWHSLPNVYFHTVTAYNILRQNGVAVGKRDFLGPVPSL